MREHSGEGGPIRTSVISSVEHPLWDIKGSRSVLCKSPGGWDDGRTGEGLHPFRRTKEHHNP